MIRLEYATPTTPMPLLPTAATVPATCVPCPYSSFGQVVVVDEVPAVDVVDVPVVVVVDPVAGDLARVRPEVARRGRGG